MASSTRRPRRRTVETAFPDDARRTARAALAQAPERTEARRNSEESDPGYHEPARGTTHTMMSNNSPQSGGMRKTTSLSDMASDAVAAASSAGQDLYDKVEEVSEALLIRPLRDARSLVEDHFLIDEAFRLLGPLHHDVNFARDAHDWFNLIALVPVIFLNAANWSGELLRDPLGATFFNTGGVASLWHGRHHSAFVYLTAGYFIADLMWMIILPKCVSSPGTIVKHHVVTLVYVAVVPWRFPEYGWCMGSCMAVELNTWFLIARRVFNKAGDHAWFSIGVRVPCIKSVRIKLISILFYVTWFTIRCALYPYLMYDFTLMYLERTKFTGTYFNVLAIAPLFQSIFVYLNAKWTIDLVRSKLKGNGPSKGL